MLVPRAAAAIRGLEREAGGPEIRGNWVSGPPAWQGKGECPRVYFLGPRARARGSTAWQARADGCAG